LDLRGTVRASQGLLVFDEGLVDDQFVDVTRASVRLVSQLTFGDIVNIEAHVVSEIAGYTTPGIASALAVGPAGDRRGEVSLYASDRVAAQLALDRLNLQLSLPKVTIVAGRQAVSLATSYFFTPNDFFVPFAATAFFRLYKPGVDALRVDIEAGELTEINLIAALEDIIEPDVDEVTAIARGSTVFGPMELAVLGGKVPGRWIAGAAFQGEVSDWFSIRGEGHVAITDDDHEVTGEVSVAIDRRFESSLHLRAEGFYHGGGTSDSAEYLGLRRDGERYVGAGYTAVGAGYELTPLLFGDLLVIVNWVDPSALVAANLSYSLAEDVEMAFLVMVPLGAEPSFDVATSTFDPGSEFGPSPFIVDIEVRAFF